jgi:uncharacterized protein DUF4124
MNRLSWIGRALAASVACAALAGPASAVEIYKWVDENGTTHYSDTRPAGVKWQVVTESKVSVIPGSRIGAEAARAAERERATAGRSPLNVVPMQDGAQARAQRRDQLLQDCQRNNGIDCDREVDTELRAEGMQEGRGVIRTVPPPVSVSPPAPVTSSSAPASSNSGVR